MKLGANSVLFGGHDLRAAFEHIALAGYDGLELSAIDGMGEHLVLANWRELAPAIKQMSRDYGLALLAMEQPSQDPAIMEQAFQAAVEIGIPIINCGPGGKSNAHAGQDVAQFAQRRLQLRMLDGELGRNFLGALGQAVGGAELGRFDPLLQQLLDIAIELLQQILQLFIDRTGDRQFRVQVF